MEDSFFDLNIFSDSNLHNDGEDDDGEIQNLAKPVDKTSVHFSELDLAFSSDFISGRKVLPIEPISKPQSPMSILKSAPEFLRLHLQEAEINGGAENGGEIMQKVAATRRNPEESLKYPSKRFSKEAMNKYLKLIKPLYSKVSKIYSDKDRSFQNLSPASMHFGKSKSASAATGLSFLGLNQRDDSLLLQVDGIQGAILHCKRSYDASRDSTSSSSSFCSDYHSLEENPRISSSRDILGH